MRKVLFLTMAMVMLAAIPAMSQLKYGGGLSLGTKAAIGDAGSKAGIGINGRVLYALNEQFTIAPNFTFWLPSSQKYSFWGDSYEIKWTVWQLNADVHYNFAEQEAFKFYGLGGLNITGWKLSYSGDYEGYFGSSSSSTEIGLNLGAGTIMNDQFFGELKFDTQMEQLAITVGILF
jgi:hypothetical protein